MQKVQASVVGLDWKTRWSSFTDAREPVPNDGLWFIDAESLNEEEKADVLPDLFMVFETLYVKEQC